MQLNSTGYILGFATLVCLVCSVFVAGSAVGLKDRQELSALLDKQKNVLQVAGLMTAGQSMSAEQVQSTFEGRIVAKLVDLQSGTFAEPPGIDPKTYDQSRVLTDPELSMAAPPNSAKVERIPRYALVYGVKNEAGVIDQVILPIHCPGLWSTLYGFLSVKADGQTIQGITFYKHGETPGLGGEVDNPKWKALWVNRKIYQEDKVAISVIKGKAGNTTDDPHHIDGLSGATLTSNGVTQGLAFWLGPDAFGPFLSQISAQVQGG